MEVNLFPNPASDFTHLSFYTQNDGTTSINVMDMTGKVVYSVQQNSLAGNNIILLETQNLASGLYIINLQTQNATSLIKLTIE
jgi:hypothetical protein